MRAIFLTTEEIKTAEVILDGDRFHHLANVVRAREGEEILVLDGHGSKGIAQIIELKKKQATLLLSQVEFTPNPHQLSVVYGCTKKEAVEEMIRRAVEVGIKKIIFFEAERSPWMYAPHSRFDKIIESALIQSNNLWAPEVVCVSKDELTETLKEYFNGIWLHLSNGKSKKDKSQNPIDLICIGPEGGWSENEVEFFKSCSNLAAITLPTPILRAEHALSVAAGYAIAINEI